MKKILAAVFFIFFLFVISACSSSSPQETVAQMVEAVKTGESEKIQSFIDYNILTDSIGQQGSADSEQYARIFSTLKYEILSSKKEGREATVSLKVFSIDMKEVYHSFLVRSLTYAKENPAEDTDAIAAAAFDAKAKEFFSQSMEDYKNQEAEFVVDVTLKKSGGKWNILLDAPLKNALTGGLSGEIARIAMDASKKQAEKAKLYEFRNFLAGDIWNNGFCAVGWYVLQGANASGEAIVIEDVLTKLSDNMEKLEEYKAFILALPKESYSSVLTSFHPLYEHLIKLYAELCENPPSKADGSYPFSTNELQRYIEFFTETVDNLIL